MCVLLCSGSRLVMLAESVNWTPCVERNCMGQDSDSADTV
jgi:hypothetical protein